MRRGFATRLLASATLIAADQPAIEAPASASATSEASRCAAPSNWNIKRDSEALPPVTNTISIDTAGTAYWNGMPIDDLRLRQYMDIVGTMMPIPASAVEVDPGSPCAQVLKVVAIIESAVDCSRHCSYATGPFDREAPPAPPAPPPPPRR